MTAPANPQLLGWWWKRKIIRLYARKHYSIRMICDKYGFERKLFTRWLRDNGVEIRSRAENAKYTWVNHQMAPKPTGAASPNYGRKASEETRVKQSASLKRYYSERIKPVVFMQNGYATVWRPEHPAAAHGRVLEHRIVVEKHIGRFLSSDEVVHHINGDKTDNRLENLEVMSRADHARLHKKKGDKQ